MAWELVSESYRGTTEFGELEWLQAFEKYDWTNGVMHAGSESGSQTQIIVLPKAGVYAAVLTNTDGNNDLAAQMLTIVLAETPVEQAQFKPGSSAVVTESPPATAPIASSPTPAPTDFFETTGPTGATAPSFTSLPTPLEANVLPETPSPSGSTSSPALNVSEIEGTSSPSASAATTTVSPVVKPTMSPTLDTALDPISNILTSSPMQGQLEAPTSAPPEESLITDQPTVVSIPKDSLPTEIGAASTSRGSSDDTPTARYAWAAGLVGVFSIALVAFLFRLKNTRSRYR